VSLHGAETTVDYPPLALVELGAAGRVYRWLHHGDYPDDTRLIVAVKAPVLLADTAMLLLLSLGLRPLLGASRANWAALAYWLNPAVLLDGAMLGYLDPLFILPACASLLAIAFGWPLLAGLLAAASCLTKPQAAILLPALAIAIWRSPMWGSASGLRSSRSSVWRSPAVWRSPLGLRRGLHPALTFAAGFAIAITAGLLPIVLAGAIPNFLQAMGRLTQHDMLSGNACNLWWIVGYVLRAYYSMHDMGVWTAFTAPTKILAISRVVELGYPNPRLIGLILFGTAAAWALWNARRRHDVWVAAALAAFLMHAYATFSVQVHENHLFAAVPLLGFAAAGRPRLTPVFVAVSAIFALNLNLFYGVSEDIGYALPRTLTIVDATVLVSIANCATLLWHAASFSRECSTAAEPRRAPVPA